MVAAADATAFASIEQLKAFWAGSMIVPMLR